MQHIQIYETVSGNISFGYVKNFDNNNNEIFLYLLEDDNYVKFLEINKTNLTINNAFTFSLSNKKVKHVEIIKRFNTLSVFYQDYNNNFIYKEIYRNITYDLTNAIRRILYGSSNFNFIGISKNSVNINFSDVIENHFAIFEVVNNNDLIYWKVELIFDNEVENLRGVLGFVPETKVFLNIKEDYKPQVVLNLDKSSIKGIKFDTSSPTFFVEL